MQKTAYEMRISDWSSDVCSSDLLCDRHVGSGTALRFLSATGEVEEFDFATLRARASRFADLLTAMGVRPGERVAGLLPRTPDLLTVLLGTLRAGAVYQPVFTAFGPKAIETRLSASSPRLVVTDTANRPKLDGLDIPSILVTDAADGPESLAAMLAGRREETAPVLLSADAPFLMLFTSGTDGTPKGLHVPIHMLRAIWGYMRYGHDLCQGDRYWNLADPGLAYGLFYGIIGPLPLGQAATLSEAESSVDRKSTRLN